MNTVAQESLPVDALLKTDRGGKHPEVCGRPHRLLLGFHRLYSRTLLRSTKRQLLRTSASGEGQ
jgi:hypothetical protein